MTARRGPGLCKRSGAAWIAFDQEASGRNVCTETGTEHLNSFIILTTYLEAWALSQQDFEIWATERDTRSEVTTVSQLL